MPHFSIIIVSWNALHHLKTFLGSVAATDYPHFEIILADNASSDGSKAWVKQHFPEIKIVTFHRNFGYCGGNNRAVPYTQGNILLFLNNDVKVDKNWLQPIAQIFEGNESVAAIQPKMRSYKRPGMFEYAGAAGGFLDKYGYPFCRGRVFDTLEPDNGQYDDEQDVFWASGAALAIRKELFQQIGGFDEHFSFHMEEIDLCWQLWNRGYRVRYCPQSVVYHLGGGSLSMDSPRKVFFNYRNSLTMLLKNYATSSLPHRLILRLMMDGISALRELFSGNFYTFRAIFKAHLRFWEAFPAIIKKRKTLQKKRTIKHNPKQMTAFSVVWRYFLKKKSTFSELMSDGEDKD